LPPTPDSFLATLPGGGRINIQYREVIGLSALLRGGFETAEAETLRRCAKPGSVAVDAGANVGVFTIPLAQAVGPQGRILAFEPLPANVKRLESNVARNALTNVEIHSLALGVEDGMTVLRLSDDPAYSSTVKVRQNRANGRTITVPVARLDSVWHQCGRPDVSTMKIDVEGAESLVLQGAEQLLAACRPVLLIEADSLDDLLALAHRLSQQGYERAQPAGFQPRNHLFVSNGGEA
jgi:FkbM family methyltransferase